MLAHAWVLAVHAHGVFLTGLMAAMTLWCAWCGIEAALRPTIHCLQRLLLMSLAMMFVHAVMLVAPEGVPGGHAHHSAEVTAAAGTQPPVEGHALAMLAIIGIEYLVAWVSAVSLRRRRYS